jgi:flagellin-specific chaperone FliS
VRVRADTWFNFSTAIDPNGKHRWGPLAPSARIEVDLDHPAQRWQGHAYLDSNEGDEPIHHACHEWDWSRSILQDGSTAVIYDIQGKVGQPADKLLALRFMNDAQRDFAEGRPSEARAAASRAADIVTELSATLRADLAPELAGALLPIYDFVIHRLLHCVLNDDTQALAEAAKTFETIAEAFLIALEKAAADGAASGRQFTFDYIGKTLIYDAATGTYKITVAGANLLGGTTASFHTVTSSSLTLATNDVIRGQAVLTIAR